VARSDTEAALTAKPNTLCRPCITQLQSQYDQLSKICEVLRLYAGGISTSNHASKVQSTPEPSTPLNVSVMDLIDDIDVILTRYENISVDDLIRQPAKEYTVWRSGRPRQEWLDGVDQALQIRVVFRRADGVIGFSRTAVTGRISPCPRCNLRTLVSVAGSDSVTCSNCGGVMPLDEYRRIVLIRADKQKRRNNN